ncbi:MAG: hypothetical protein IJ710_09705 [Prevotella sp.]|nr:hypothetical protein [Prevotella sp.]
MKTRHYILMALTALLAASCMDGDWDAPESVKGQAAYGNQNIQETNVVTIADLKKQFASEISGGTAGAVTTPTQVKGVVLGNDAGGNLYSEIYIADETGAIQVRISQSGLYGYLPVGQTVLIELNGLYVGGYGKQPQIGNLYNGGTGRMTRYEWYNHFKLVGAEDGILKTVTPIEVTDISQLSLDNDVCKLVTLKGVEIVEANGTMTYAPENRKQSSTQNYVHNTFRINGKAVSSSTLVLRTSTFADFAPSVMPTGKLDVTGIASRFNNTWQIYLRTEADVKAAE